MNEVKHTPGPWGATTRQGSWDWLVYSEADPNIEICQMFHDGTDFNDTGEANSILVVSAPDMLNVLKASVKQLNLILEDGIPTDFRDWRNDLEKIIAKAEGRSL